MSYPGLPITWLTHEADDYQLATIFDIDKERNDR